MSDVSGPVEGRTRTGILRWDLRRLKPYGLFPLLGVIAFLTAYPIFMVVYASFKGGPPGADAPFSFQGYTSAWGDWATIRALGVTFGLLAVRVPLAVFLAVMLAWILTRTNTPFRGFFEQVLWLKIFLPALPMLVAWLLLLSGKSSIINKFLMDQFSLSKPPLDIQTYWGVIFITLAGMGAYLYMYMAPAFRNMDASLEESSRVSGASNLTTLFRITVPVLMPAILGVSLLSLLMGLGSFETELFLLSPKGEYVFSTWIWWRASKLPPDYPGAMALSTAFILFVTLVIIVQSRVLSGREFTTVTGRGFGVRVLDLGKWRWVAFGILVTDLVLFLALPLAVLISGTVTKAYGLLDSGLTLQHWRFALDQSALIRSFTNTLLLGTMAATLGAVLHGSMSYIAIRTRLKGRKVVDALSWVPRAAPPVVLGLGMVWAILGGIPGIQFLYGTLFLMALVIVLERTPMGMRMFNGGMVQIAPELEEAARTAGASWFRTTTKVLLPLLAPTIVNAWLMGFMGGTRALVIVLFIYMPASKVLTIDIFERMVSSLPQEAAILGVMLTAMSMVVMLIARIFATRYRQYLA